MLVKGFKVLHSQVSPTRHFSTLKLSSSYKLFIDNEWIPSINNKTFPVENPFNGDILCYVSEAEEADVNKAIDIGYDSFEKGIWRKMDVRERSTILNKGAAILRERVNDIAVMETLQTGRPIREMNAQLQRLPEWLEYYASLIRTYNNICPPFKNHPLLIALKKISPALATGNSIVLKTSELAPCSVLEFGNIMKEAGLPNGVLNIINGYGNISGKTLVSSPKISKIDLTGGSETGKIIGSIAGGNLVNYCAELGGKCPMIVFDDVLDINEVVNGVVFGTFIASGQTCIAGTRLLLHENIYGKFIKLLVNKVKNIKLGNPLDYSTQLGPVISKLQRDKILDFISCAKENDNGNIIYGGNIPNENNLELKNGYFVSPTIIIDCDSNMNCVKEEIFGPVLVVLPFKDECDAIKIANDSKYGLAASIWTSNISKAKEIIDNLNVGICWINDHHRNDPSSPWGGMKLSGLGRENGYDAFHEYTQSKSTIINCNNKPFDWFINDNNLRYS